ncbi:AAA family ATPase [Lacinutrix sp. MedPE-SW]|uniref:AAA family ATPase n=1 Tax=Lacinutrix sp. MedPE-SW TaxID=1860087 RepID=UPI000922DF29|nr:AAA family ATPase [Lacinutrix sp. MedPE-SW]OIQ21981.1 MAG: LuxR family transcriptional regulator [Lacinutrix sp. MedPE-SW]
MNDSAIQKIADDIQSNESKLELSAATQGCLIIKKTKKWIEEAKKRPIPNMLFSEFWYENELCILFADTNLGKSILAVQIADSLSKGKPIYGFKLEAKPKKVLYLDFELSDKQLENRYSLDYTKHYSFSDNFLRAELNSELTLPKGCNTIEDYICDTLEQTVDHNEVEVLIIDNLTYLNNDNEKAKYALHLMKVLKKLTKSASISILVLSHTPKRDNSKPLTKNDLAGSKMLMNFCDSSFAIGESSQTHNYRYLKQIKQRNTEQLYHSSNVIVCSIEKNINFLTFNFIEFDEEKSHLKSPVLGSLEDRDDKMIKLIKDGLSNVKIGEELGISESTVRKRRKKLNL